MMRLRIGWAATFRRNSFTRMDGPLSRMTRTTSRRYGVVKVRVVMVMTVRMVATVVVVMVMTSVMMVQMVVMVWVVRCVLLAWIESRWERG